MKQPKRLTKQQQIQLLVFFISCFTVSVTPSINTPKSSSDFMILIISFISSFEINIGLTAPVHYLLSNLLIAFGAILTTYLGKLSVAKGITTFASAICLNYLTKNQKIHQIKLLLMFEFYIC